MSYARDVEARTLRGAYKKARQMFRGNLTVAKVIPSKKYRVYVKQRKRRTKRK